MADSPAASPSFSSRTSSQRWAPEDPDPSTSNAVIETEAPSDSTKDPSRKASVLPEPSAAVHALTRSSSRTADAPSVSSPASGSVSGPSCSAGCSSEAAGGSASAWPAVCAMEQRTAVVATTIATMPMAAAIIALFFLCMGVLLSLGYL